MTYTDTAKLYTDTAKLYTSPFRFIGRFFRGISNTIMESRQRSANYEVARMLQATEYQNESFSYILDMVERGSIERDK